MLSASSLAHKHCYANNVQHYVLAKPDHKPQLNKAGEYVHDIECWETSAHQQDQITAMLVTYSKK